MMLSNLNLSSLPECNFEVRYVDSVLLNPCAEYQRLLRMSKVAKIAANFSEYIANEPKVSYRDGRYFVFDGQNTIEARKTCNGGRDLPIRCKVFYGLSKEHEALLFAVQTGISSELTAGEQLRAKLVAHEENACDFVSVTEDTGVRFALDGIRAPWKIYCIRSAYYIYKSYGASLYREMLSVLVDAWGGDSDSFLSGILHGMARFLALYQGEYSRERLILRLRTVHPKTITRLAQNDTGNVADRHMKQKLEQQGYEAKRGKHTAVKGKGQKRFIRFRTLGTGYSEEEIKAVLEGKAKHQPYQRKLPKEQTFQLLVDIQGKMAEGKSVGYKRWATKFNLKEMSKTLLFLQEQKISSAEELRERAAAATKRYHAMGDSIKAAETRLAEIAVLKTHIINYAKTRPVYDAYRKSGYSKKFLEAHREEITLHKAAKAAFDEAGLQKLPKVKELDAEFAELLTKKKASYPDYRKARNEMQELVRAQKNVERFFAEEKDTTEKTQTR